MPAQDTNATSSDPQDLIAKFQQSIAEKVNNNSQFQNPNPQEKKEEKVEIEETKPIEPVELAPVEQQKDLSKPSTGSAITYNLQPTTSFITNPNAILELTKADIFKLLGMFKIPETEKKKNLDEMEETIWADFVEEDLPEMLREDQKEPFREFLKTSPSAEKIINFFGNPPTGGLPSNFEEKYLAKTLEFKAEITKEQIETLLVASDDPEKKKIFEQAKTAASNGNWRQVEDLMMNFG